MTDQPRCETCALESVMTIITAVLAFALLVWMARLSSDGEYSRASVAAITAILVLWRPRGEYQPKEPRDE